MTCRVGGWKTHITLLSEVTVERKTSHQQFSYQAFGTSPGIMPSEELNRTLFLGNPSTRRKRKPETPGFQASSQHRPQGLACGIGRRPVKFSRGDLLPQMVFPANSRNPSFLILDHLGVHNRNQRETPSKLEPVRGVSAYRNPGKNKITHQQTGQPAKE